jgi:sulfur carrier protein ThiS
MKQDIEQIEDAIGVLTEFKIQKEQLVSDLLKELNLNDKFFAILVNGKKASINDKIEEGSDIVILPRIAGG